MNKEKSIKEEVVANEAELPQFEQEEKKIEIENCYTVNMKTGNKKLNRFKIAKKIAHDKKIIFTAEFGFLKFEDDYYKEVSKQELKALATEIIEQIDYDIREHDIGEIHKLMQVINIVDKEALNPENYINLKNGILDLNSFEFQKHTQKDELDLKFTYKIDVQYDPSAESQTFEIALDKIFDYSGKCIECGRKKCDPECKARKIKDKKDKISALQEFCGYCFCQEYKQKKALILYGDTDSGKTTIGKVLTKMFGVDSVSSFTIQELGKESYRAELYKKILNISFDNPPKKFDESRFKTLTGNDYVSARKLYKSPFKFQNTCKLFLIFNELPQIDDRSKATLNRFLVLETPNCFQNTPMKELGEFKKDVDLEDKLLEEANKSGILNWILKGLKRFRSKNCITIPESSNEIIDEIKLDSSGVYKFMKEFLETQDVVHITFGNLYKNYENYLSRHNITKFKVSKTKFGRELRNMRHIKAAGKKHEINLKNHTNNVLYVNIKQR